MNEPTSPRAARSRDKLLRAATELLVESGPRSVTVDAVETASGVAKSTLYRHFASRDELLIAVVRCNVPAFEVPDLSHGFEVALRAFVGSAAAAFAHSEWARIFPAVVSLRTSMPEFDELIQMDRNVKQDELHGILDLGVTEGALPVDLDIDTTTSLLIGPLVFAAITGTAGCDVGADLASLADQIVDRFIASYR